MKIKIFKPEGFGVIFSAVIFLLVVTIAYAIGSSNFLSQAKKYIDSNCSHKHIDNHTALLCYLFYKTGEQDSAISSLSTTQSSQGSHLNSLQTQTNANTSDVSTLKGYKKVLDIENIRGSSFNTSSSTATATPDKVTVTCPVQCLMTVTYFVDTRNNATPGGGNWYQNLYGIWLDGQDQAVFNQASFPVANTAVPLSVNGVFLGNAGIHTIQIYAWTNGGQLQSYESGLQVVATTP